MMDKFTEDTEESQFFDALDHIAPTSNSVSDCPVLKDWEYDVWISTPQSVRERRNKFIRWMQLSSNGLEGGDSDNSDTSDSNTCGDKDRIEDVSGAVLRTSRIDDEFSSSRSSLSTWSTDHLDSSRELNLKGFRNCSGNSDEGSECNVSHSSPSVHQEIEVDGNSPRTANRLKKKLLSKLRSFTCMMSVNLEEESTESNRYSQVQLSRPRRVRVRHSQRKSKELSAFFTVQEIQAHKGSILAMKFSPDGKYLASAGEDKIVRIWQVMEDERSDTIDIPDADPSCAYFSVNHLSELGPLTVQKDDNKSKNLKKTPESACVIFPPTVFRILEKPLHVFEGHNGEILDLSWSKNNSLLSSSVDKTVRLWRVGVDRCLKVFSHSDYVTCIHFNPVDDDYFISGSIDGKVRIWAINECQVVDWTETKDIITAVSYRPDGKGGIIGSITGTCYFFALSDNRVKLEKQACLASKKKSPCKRITGFQFLPQDPSKVLVTCADSLVRIIDGMDVIGKYKGLRNAQISASFTPSGKHIVSASEDSNVYIWNYTDQEASKANRSFECFSSDASIVAPWSGFQIENSENDFHSRKDENSINPLPFSSPSCFSLGQDSFFDSNPRGSSATWPEEKLPLSDFQALPSQMSKSEYKLLKNSCQSSSNSHAWGLVLVTASWDGRIRSFHNYGLPIPV